MHAISTVPAFPRRSPYRHRLVAVLASVCLTAALFPGAGPAAAAAVYQAENATVGQGMVESTWPGFTGTGYVNYNNVAGSYVEWNVSAAQAGSVRLRFRYANGGTANRPMDITVNGGVAAGELAFPPTGAWST